MVVTPKEHYVVDLSALQAIYERNYSSLMRLLPAIRNTGYSRCIAFTADQKIATHLTFTVLENSPYTSYILLKQDSLLDWIIAPQLYIRCYHDAQLAEVTFARNSRSFRGIYVYPNKAMHQPDEKRQLNQFLGEWLIRCLTSGYDLTKIELNK